MNKTKLFLADKKVHLLLQYDEALDRNLTFLAKGTRIKLNFLDELIRESEKIEE